MGIKINFCNLSAIDKKNKKIMSRNSSILDYHVGKSFYVHKGNGFNEVFINPRMKGFCFGDFCLTRKPFSHKNKNK